MNMDMPKLIPMPIRARREILKYPTHPGFHASHRSRSLLSGYRSNNTRTLLYCAIRPYGAKSEWKYILGMTLLDANLRRKGAFSRKAGSRSGLSNKVARWKFLDWVGCLCVATRRASFMSNSKQELRDGFILHDHTAHYFFPITMTALYSLSV